MPSLGVLQLPTACAEQLLPPEQERQAPLVPWHSPAAQDGAVEQEPSRQQSARQRNPSSKFCWRIGRVIRFTGRPNSRNPEAACSTPGVAGEPRGGNRIVA